MKITFEKTVVGRWKAASLGHRSGIYVYEQNEQNKKFTEKKNKNKFWTSLMTLHYLTIIIIFLWSRFKTSFKTTQRMPAQTPRPARLYRDIRWIW
jgi:pheromone shutdown protein TraB